MSPPLTHDDDTRVMPSCERVVDVMTEYFYEAFTTQGLVINCK